MTRLLKLLALASLLFTTAPALAQYPEKPIKIIVAFPPGGTNDNAARIVADKMQHLLKQPVIVENKAGAGGMIGAQFVANAAPDGYTLFMASGGHTVLPALHKSMPYDLQKNFAPIGLVCTSGYAIVVRASTPVRTLPELVSYAKSKPNVNYASTGTGVLTHLAGEWFKEITGTKSAHIPYKGDTPALSALLGNQVDYSVLSITPSLPHIRSGGLRALAVTSKTRSSSLPDVPTVAEALHAPDFNISTWFGLLAPAGTPPQAISRLSGALKEILEMPDVRAKFAAQAMEVTPTTPSQYAAIIKTDTERAAKIARSIGIKPE